MHIGDVEYPSLKGRVPDAEWETRVDLAAIYRLIVEMGWSDLAGAPASAKVPNEEAYLINPMGFLFDEITASSLVKITLDGLYASETPFQFSRAVWYSLEAVHAVRPDANWVIHTHDDYGLALSARKERLLPATQGAGFAIADGVVYHDYDGVETYPEQMAGLQRSLGQANRMILHNHGLLTIGTTAYQAFSRMAGLSKACRVQLLAGREQDLIALPPSMIETFQDELRRGPAVDNYWPGLLRKLDRTDASYRS